MASILNSISKFFESIEKNEKKKQENIKALIERATQVDAIARTVLVVAFTSAIVSVLATQICLSICCALIAYSSYEVATVAKKVKNFAQEGLIWWWQPQLGFGENFCLDKATGEQKNFIINTITEDAPLANQILKLIYK